MKSLIIYFFLFSFSLFAEDKNEFKKINTFKATITEKSHLNNRTKTKEYQILARLPDKLKKNNDFSFYKQRRSLSICGN